jgi:hypothetical protein
VTVAMSDRDYAILLAAIGWIEHHAGKDAPNYPEIEMLTHVVNNISQRREPSDGPTPRSFGAERTSELLKLHRFDHVPTVHDAPEPPPPLMQPVHNSETAVP